MICIIKPKLSMFKSSLLVVLALFFLVMGDLNAAAPSSDVSATDVDTPVIKSTIIKTVLAPGESVRISAVVTDNRGVTSVTVFYRNVGDIDFQQVDMIRTKDSDDFSVVISNLKEPGLEYYIQAGDKAENIVLQGHTFAPLEITVGAGTTATVSAQLPTKTIAKAGISKWVWIGLSVVAIAAVVSSGDGDDEGEAPGVVVIGAPAPQ